MRAKLYARKWQVLYRYVPDSLNGKIEEGLIKAKNEGEADNAAAGIRALFGYPATDCLLVTLVPPNPTLYRSLKERRKRLKAA